MTAPEVKQSPAFGRTGLVTFAGAAFAVPLLYALYTEHVWEDFFIVFKFSQNLCEGHGLVYQVGERVHGFTSPLGTLVPALCYWVTGRTSYLPALWLFRVLSAGAFAGGGVLFLKALRAGGASKPVSVAFAVLYLLDVNAVEFSSDGMETGFMLLFLGWGMYLLARGEPGCWLAMGICWAGLMWTRPDGCVYIASLALAILLFEVGPRYPWLVSLEKSAAICAALYLPWFVGAWLYYGSPVPHTIHAKANYQEGYHNWAVVVQHTLQRFPSRSASVFQPIYALSGGWPAWVMAPALYLALFCSVYWLFPINDRFGRRASFCFALLGLYISFQTIAFPWYLPPMAVLGLLVLTGGSAACARALPRGRAVVGSLVAAGLLLLIGFNLSVFGMTAWQVKVQQAEIEWGNRAPIGHWLKENVGGGERVYLECPGYIGYFSDAKMLDYPGLVSPEVVRAARQKPNDFPSIGLRLKPEWMVLRPIDEKIMSFNDDFARHYKPVKVFDVTDRLDTYSFLPGKGLLMIDARFTVFRRAPEDRASTRESD